MREKLVIVGTGLFAEVACAYFEEYTNYEVVAFACHESFKTSDEIFGHRLLAIENLARECSPADADVFVAIGYGQMNKMRQRVYKEMKERGYRCATFVHPGVKIWDSTTVGDNVFIFEDNTVQPFTRIGSNTVLWSGNHIGHHSSIGDHCFISSHVMVAGSCKLGDNVFIGVNATLHDSLEIGDECLIGAGAIISKKTAPKSVYITPATKVYSKTSDQVGF